jgi:hypothetical protein
MARRKVSSEQLQNIHDLAAGWGRIVATRAFGEAGPGTDVDLDAMEEIAAAAAAGLTQGTFSTLLEQQAQRLGSEQPCPQCGKACTVQRHDRTLTVRGGQQLTHSEPICHCPDCRRDFFPPTTAAPPRRPRL